MAQSFRSPRRDPNKLPYEIITQHDGTEIMRDRLCRPLWKRKPGEPAQEFPTGGLKQIIQNIHHRKYLYDSPVVSRRLRRELLEIEQQFMAGFLIREPEPPQLAAWAFNAFDREGNPVRVVAWFGQYAEDRRAEVEGRPHLRRIAKQ